MTGSRYIQWAKSREGYRYNLGRSSIRACPAADLGARRDDFQVQGSNAHGWPPLLDLLAARYAVDPGQVVLAIGTSMANHLACAALLSPGDHVLIEEPGYEPLVSLPAYLGAEVGRFARRRQDGWNLDVDAIRAQVKPGRTRLLIVSDLHNPTGVRADAAALGALAGLAAEHDFHVLFDEVYLEFTDDRMIAARRSERFVSTCSLTKAYGLDGLRAGWIVAAPPLAEHIRRLNDLFGIIMPHPTERLAARALQRIEIIGANVSKLVATNRALVAEFVDHRPELEWQLPTLGPLGFARLTRGTVDALVDLLETEHDTTAPPGAFFGADDHFRLAFGMETNDLIEGLSRLELALDTLSLAPGVAR